MRHRFVEANGVRFHLAEAGAGPLVLLLHGFPECWYSWRRQLPALAAAGYHAVAPDLRGYNLTDKPRGGYNIESLVADVAALIEALDEHEGSAHVVGHDWGGVIGWQTAWRRPERARTLVALNAPHPAAFAEHVRSHPFQLLASSYMLAMQIPHLPEWLLTRNDAAAVASALRRGAHRGSVFAPGDLEVYRRAMLRPGAAAAAINYYRQAIRQGTNVLPNTPITVPTLALWGIDDPLLQIGSNRGLRGRVADLTFKRIASCGHWTQQERPDAVNRELLAWLAARTGYP